MSTPARRAAQAIFDMGSNPLRCDMEHFIAREYQAQTDALAEAKAALEFHHKGYAFGTGTYDDFLLKLLELRNNALRKINAL